MVCDVLFITTVKQIETDPIGTRVKKIGSRENIQGTWKVKNLKANVIFCNRINAFLSSIYDILCMVTFNEQAPVHHITLCRDNMVQIRVRRKHCHTRKLAMTRNLSINFDSNKHGSWQLLPPAFYQSQVKVTLVYDHTPVYDKVIVYLITLYICVQQLFRKPMCTTSSSCVKQLVRQSFLYTCTTKIICHMLKSSRTQGLCLQTNA